MREGRGRFRAFLKRAESGPIPLPGPYKAHRPAFAFHASTVAARSDRLRSRFLDSGFASARNDKGRFRVKPGMTKGPVPELVEGPDLLSFRAGPEPDAELVEVFGLDSAE